MDGDVITLYQANQITQARYEFTLIEKRIIYQIVHAIRKRYIIDKRGDKNLFGDLLITLTHKQLSKVSGNSNQVYASIRRLVSKFYEFDDENEWMILHIVNTAKHKKKDAVWEITVGKEMVEKFVDLAKNYTAYSLMVAMSLRSEHSQRLYEYCSQFKASGGFRMSVKDMREKMKLEHKYSRYGSMKKYVLEVARKELKTMYDEGTCDLYFEYTESRNGRSVSYLSFKIISSKDEDAMVSLDDMMHSVRLNLSTIFRASEQPKNKTFVDKVMQKLILNPDLLKHCYGKLAFVGSSIPKEERQPYMRYVITQEYLKDDE